MSDESTVTVTNDPGGDARAYLVIDDASTRRIAIPESGYAVLGRAEDAELRVTSTSVSRRHARFVVRPDGTVTVEDLVSHNGTRIGGVGIAAGHPLPIRVGDVVECGTVLVLLARAEPIPPSERPSLVVSDDARWFRRDEGDIVNLGRRGALRLLLAELVARRIDAPGTALSVEQMFAAGWPGETIAFTSAQARVYTSVQRLRALGLEGLLVTRGDGYLLEPAADVRRG
jgi:pSer/pThr/pTyr-binding forkhead associated (FHA) protein